MQVLEVGESVINIINYLQIKPQYLTAIELNYKKFKNSDKIYLFI